MFYNNYDSELFRINFKNKNSLLNNKDLQYNLCIYQSDLFSRGHKLINTSSESTKLAVGQFQCDRRYKKKDLRSLKLPCFLE